MFGISLRINPLIRPDGRMYDKQPESGSGSATKTVMRNRFIHADGKGLLSTLRLAAPVTSNTRALAAPPSSTIGRAAEFPVSFQRSIQWVRRLPLIFARCIAALFSRARVPQGSPGRHRVTPTAEEGGAG